MTLVEELSAILSEETTSIISGRVARDVQAGRCELINLDHLPPEDLCGCDADSLIHDLDAAPRKRGLAA